MNVRSNVLDLKLTPAQSKVSLLVLNGLSNAEVASKLNIAPKTVKFHCTSIYRRAGVASRSAFISKYVLESVRAGIDTQLAALIVELDAKTEQYAATERSLRSQHQLELIRAGASTRSKSQIEAAVSEAVRNANVSHQLGQKILNMVISELKFVQLEPGLSQTATVNQTLDNRLKPSHVNAARLTKTSTG